MSTILNASLRSSSLGGGGFRPGGITVTAGWVERNSLNIEVLFVMILGDSRSLLLNSPPARSFAATKTAS